MRFVKTSALRAAGVALGACLVLGAGAQAAQLQEITLATPDQALAYCKSGKMASGDVAYIAGTGGLAQFGPDQKCTQQVPSAKSRVSKAIEVKGKGVAECTMVAAKKATSFCNSGNMGTWNIDYIAGKVALTISGPGYGCGVGTSTSSIGTALCK